MLGLCVWLYRKDECSGSGKMVKWKKIQLPRVREVNAHSCPSGMVVMFTGKG
jgi:phage-related protein